MCFFSKITRIETNVLTGIFRFGYVSFDGVEAATRAIEAMHMRIMAGRRVFMHYALPIEMHKTMQRPATNSLFVGNLAYDLTDFELHDLFRDIENVVDVRLAVDRRTGNLRGYCHVDFIDSQSAHVAREILSQRSPHGRRLFIQYSLKRSRVADGLWKSDSPVK